ncbi:TlpA disulfide reductase family protein [Mangrovivirga sp. M17]|uniref:TlpA disulfide reductase family protein n=1 Tax=Mangrovivirga halotolerans TaxID=2993936 RepID=A0ABT3RUN9_9BACT|nr:TlpA disulfide reductase family protein [Mangrovivirga halotolerans]MCX2745496.1 TlpA disulfide reductase family protein [Mangrovivirga halotolerans]
MKKPAIKIISGIVISTIIMGLMFYLFLFLNPLRIYESNTLKWIPILITIISIFISGRINRKTPIKYLPFLFLPFILFKPFNFAYFPFILYLIGVGILALIVSRTEIPFNFRLIAWTGITCIFIFFLFSQPLILVNDGFKYDENGDLLNATTLWEFNKEDDNKLPDHLLIDKNNHQINIAEIPKTTHLITFWATWCAPCMQEKSQLQKLKQQYKNNNEILFIDISFDTNKDKWLRYINQNNPSGLQLISTDQQLTSRSFNFQGIPMHLIVHPDGSYEKYHSLEAVKNILLNTEKL